MDKKIIFYTLAMYKSGGSSAKQAGIAIAAVMATGQKVFAQVVVDQRGRTVTEYYTLNPAGLD